MGARGEPREAGDEGEGVEGFTVGTRGPALDLCDLGLHLAILGGFHL
jgi:hypothetical protein